MKYSIASSYINRPLTTTVLLVMNYIFKREKNYVSLQGVNPTKVKHVSLISNKSNASDLIAMIFPLTLTWL